MSYGEAAQGVLTRVFEEMAMLFAEPADPAGATPPVGEVLEAKIRFQGAQRGELTIFVPTETVVEFAANTLGVDAGDIDDQEAVFDAAKELANVAAGQLLPEIAGVEQVFELTPPSARCIDAGEWAAFAARAGVAALLVEDAAVLIGVEVIA
ncbi:MAG: chemotaxis protein CheX [Planctomycetes bacterium]|nr:chemotaxis protein CheX [Planctomycetota bacterium]MCB9868718.1 chemotaxis protein CheX [Planctomycetota bacterium]MCB9889890.1 chemotaxis protein CheX [Planctomycetota bacterium]